MLYRLHNGGMDTILPDIIDVAVKHGLDLMKVGHRNEYRANCPFCQDKHRKLYLNPDKNIFNCYHGGCPSNAGSNGGGVVKFIALLTSSSENSVMDEIKRQARERRADEPRTERPKHPVFTHPARKLTAIQRELMEMKGPSFYQYIKMVEEGKTTLDQVLAQLDFTWQAWQEYVTYQREYALIMLYVGIFEGHYNKVVEHLKKKEQETGIELLEPALKNYSKPNPSKKALEIRKRAYRFYVDQQLYKATKVS